MKNFFLIFLFIWICFEQPVPARENSRLELLHADFSRGAVKGEKRLRILEGQVHARQDSLEIFCDRAVYDEAEKKIILTGAVELIRGQDTLLAQRVTYFETDKIAIAERDVRVFRPGQSLRSQFLEYHYETDQIRASGKMLLHDANRRVFLSGERGEHLPKLNLSYLENRAHLWRVDSTSRDTMHIYSRRMEYHTGENRLAIARDSVHIFQGALHATCDSAVYFLDEEIANLEKNPHAVQDNNKMTGRQMKLIMKDLELEQILVNGSARAVSVEDSLLEKENRLEGRELRIYIQERKLKELWAISNARSLYYLKEEAENKGINTASADTIKAFFQDNELDSILVIGGSQGVYYPQDYKGTITEE